MYIFGRIPRRLAIFVAFIAIIFAVYFFWSLAFGKSPYVPEQFLEANKQSAIIASQIVDYSDQSAKTISDINKLDIQGRYFEAIELVSGELKRNEELKESSYKLSLQLGEMAEVLPDIKPRRATEVALSALNYETLIVLQLVNYSNSLNDLLVALDDKFRGRMEFPEGKVEEMVAKINSEAIEINELNERYKETIKIFEDLVKEE